jgi:hypothetical protein
MQNMEAFPGVVVAIVVFFIGRLIAGGQNPPTITLNTDSGNTNCSGLCVQLRNRRSSRCTAEAAARNAQARVDNLSTQLKSAAIAAAVALAAAYTALSIPVIGLFLAPSLLAAATVLEVVVIGLLGALSVAESDRQDKVNAVSSARQLEIETLTRLGAECGDSLENCLKTVPPCS